MVYCVQLYATLSNTQSRDRFLAVADQGFQPNSVWGPNRLDNIPASDSGDGFPGVACERRYNLQADAQSLYDRFSAEADSRVPRPGSYLRIHACTHDPAQPTTPCAITAQRAW